MLYFIFLVTSIDLETFKFLSKGGGGKLSGGKTIHGDGSVSDAAGNMSLCVETTNVLATSMGTSSSSAPLLEESTNHGMQSTISTIASQATISTNILQAPITAIQSSHHDKLDQHLPPPKSIAKLVVANHATTNNCGTVLQKVNSPLNITVLNPSGPLTVVKTLCVTSGVSSTPQFTLVNSTPLNVTNAMGKSPTFTLLNAPLTVVKAITTASQPIEKNGVGEISSNIANNQANLTGQPTSNLMENRGHNVFVKNTSLDSTVQDMPQSHKILTANNFASSNVSIPLLKIN